MTTEKPNNYDYTVAKRVKKYTKRQAEKGLTRVSVRAYPEDRDAVLEHATKLRRTRELERIKDDATI